MEILAQSNEEHDPWREERLRRLAEWGINQDEFLSEEAAPPVDRDRLIALANRQLSESEAREVCELMARYRSWSDTFGAVLSELSKQSDRPQDDL